MHAKLVIEKDSIMQSFFRRSRREGDLSTDAQSYGAMNIEWDYLRAVGGDRK
jgi:hypothetical protein